MSDNIRFGVIGVGAIGPSHVFAIEHTEGAELGAVCDIRPEAAKSLADEHGVPYFTDVDAMLSSGLVDAVTLCTPSGFHLDTALKVVAAGKHLLVEKPLEVTTERIDQIIAAGHKNGAKVACSFQVRFSPVCLELKRRIDAGMLGEIYTGSAHSMYYRTEEYYASAGWRGTWKVDGGGCLMNQGIHIVDQFLWFMGDVQSVAGIVETKGRNIEVETLAIGMISFKNGAKGHIEASTLAYPGTSPFLEIVGSRGTVVYGGGKLKRLDLIDPTDEETAWKESILARQAIEEAEEAKKPAVAPGTAIAQVDMGHTPVFADFVDAIKNDREPLVNGEEARRSVELITAIYESGKEGSKVIELA